MLKLFKISLQISLFFLLLLFSSCTLLKPYPQLKISSRNYNKEELILTFTKLPQIKKFSQNYSTKVELKLREEMINYLVREAEKKEEDSKILKSFLKKTLPPTAKSFSLPCYVEKAKFNGKPSWIIVENWGFKKNEKLNQIRIWVIDVKRGDVLFAYSLNPP